MACIHTEHVNGQSYYMASIKEVIAKKIGGASLLALQFGGLSACTCIVFMIVGAILTAVGMDNNDSELEEVGVALLAVWGAIAGVGVVAGICLGCYIPADD